jgi:hypothetical protein
MHELKNNEWKIISKRSEGDLSCSNVSTIPVISMERLGKNTRNFSDDSRCLDQDSNRGLLNSEPRTLRLFQPFGEDESIWQEFQKRITQTYIIPNIELYNIRLTNNDERSSQIPAPCSHFRCGIWGEIRKIALTICVWNINLELRFISNTLNIVTS